MSRKREDRRPVMAFGRRMPTERAKDFKGTLRQLVKYLVRERYVIIFTAILAMFGTVMGVLAPRILGGATDEIHQGVMRMLTGTGGIHFEPIRNIMLIMIGLHATNITMNYIQGFIMAGLAVRITYRLRTEISEKIHRLPLKYFDKTPYGDVLSRITNDVDTLSNTLASGINPSLMAITAVLGIIIMMLTISPLLTLAAMLVLPLSGISVRLIIKRSQKYFKAQQESLGKLNGHIEEMFTNHNIVRAFNGEEISAQAFAEHNDALYQAGWKANFLSGLMMPIIGFISNLGYVVIVVIGGTMAAGGGRLTIGGIQAFIQYTRQLGQPMGQLAGVAASFQQTAAAAERVFAFLAEEEESPDAADPVTIEKTQGRIDFRNISFAYDPDKPIIGGFSASAAQGAKVAIVGATGAGKTTIVKLLMRFYDVAAGEILLDGHNIQQMRRDDLRRHFGMILQDTWLFNGTIADNIRYGNPQATDEQVQAAARAAQAHHFIRALPDAYNMEINEEADNISAGQKQLLTIARAFLVDPDILILDEATSNVDTRTEVQIQRAMDNIMKGRTAFIIAHRLSTIRRADTILVMRDGDIVEQGPHKELIDKGGVYAELYKAQFDE